jgi:hypothetical protein
MKKTASDDETRQSSEVGWKAYEAMFINQVS